MNEIDQVYPLEKSFEAENNLEPERKTQLAKKLGLQPRQVAVWFQNRRARWKTNQLERDYDLLKSSYDSLLAEFDPIVKENEKFKSEQANERIEAKPAGIGPYSLISNVEGKRRNPVFILCNSVIDYSPLYALLAGDVQGGGRNRNPRQITGRNADHTALHVRVAVPAGGPDAGGGGGPDADGGGVPDAGGGGGPPGGGPDDGGGGGPPGGGPEAGGGGGPDAGGGGGPDAGGGGNLAVCVFTASVGKAALLRYTATPGSSRSRSGSTKSEVLSYLIMTFDTVAFLTSFAAIYMRRKRPQVSTILGNVAAFSLILSFLCMNMKDEFLA